MKNILFCIFFGIIYGVTSYGQFDFTKVDEKVNLYPKTYKSPKYLAQQIEADFTTDLEKVRAIYTWIVGNIAYSYSEVGQSKTIYYTSQEELVEKQKLQKKEIALRAITKNKAVCEGYTALFNELCGELNIKSRYVSGATKRDYRDIGEKYISSHAWNVVEIFKKEYLIDTTWGAGFWGENGFEKNVSYFYFLTDPTVFIENHYPDDYKDSLLRTRISKTKFLKAALVYSESNDDFKLLRPKVGTINTYKKSKVKFSFTASSKKINWIFYTIGNNVTEVADYTIKDGIIKFQLDIFKEKSQELTIFFNGKATATHKLL